MFSNLTNISAITIQRDTPTFYPISNYLCDLDTDLDRFLLSQEKYETWN